VDLARRRLDADGASAAPGHRRSAATIAATPMPRLMTPGVTPSPSGPRQHPDDLFAPYNNADPTAAAAKPQAQTACLAQQSPACERWLTSRPRPTPKPAVEGWAPAYASAASRPITEQMKPRREPEHAQSC
jgi:hypothetical protein